jgi:hypothetical protein
MLPSWKGTVRSEHLSARSAALVGDLFVRWELLGKVLHCTESCALFPQQTQDPEWQSHVCLPSRHVLLDSPEPTRTLNYKLSAWIAAQTRWKVRNSIFLGGCEMPGARCGIRLRLRRSLARLCYETTVREVGHAFGLLRWKRTLSCLSHYRWRPYGRG